MNQPQAIIEDGKDAFYRSLTEREMAVVEVFAGIVSDFKSIYGHEIILKYQRDEMLRVDYSHASKVSSQSLEEAVSVSVVTQDGFLMPAGRIERAATDFLNPRVIEGMVLSCMEKINTTNYDPTETTKLADVEPNVRTYSVKPGIDNNSLTFGEKLGRFDRLLEQTDIVIDGTSFKGRITYEEIDETRIVVGSNGTLVKDVRTLPELSIEIVGDKEGQGKKVRYERWRGIGGLEATLENETVVEGIKTIQKRLNESYGEVSFADYCGERGLVMSDVYQNSNLVFAPLFFAVLLHEAIGHPVSEAELILIGDSVVSENGRVKPMQIAVPGFNAAFLSNEVLCNGYRPVDDEGTHIEKLYVVKDGMIGGITGLLHSRSTAAQFGVKPNGNCVSEKGWDLPYPRQNVMKWEIDESKLPCYGSTPNELTIEEFYSMVQENPDKFFGKDHDKTLFFIDGTRGGAVSTAVGEFSLNSQDTYVARYGEAPVRIKPFTFKGNATEFLKDNIDYVIGCKPTYFKGRCGKHGQWTPSVTFGEHAIVSSYDHKKMIIAGDR